jgi:phospholipase/carboxylesterase
MKQLSLGGLDVRLAGGSDREGGGDGPLVILCHGYGAPGTDLVPLWREMIVPRSTRFLFPEAPLGLELAGAPPGARTWWNIDIGRFEAVLAGNGDVAALTREVPEGLAESRDKILRLLEEAERELGAKQFVLGGFSQGAMLALDVALRTDRKLAGLVLMSATLIARDEWMALMPTRKALPVLQSHGRADPLLPFFVAEALRDLMLQHGLAVRFVPFNGGHAISGGVLDEVGQFIGRVMIE